MSTLTFNYKEKFSFWIFLPGLVFIGLAVYTFMEKTGIRYKGRSLLDYPTSFYIPSAIGLLFIIYGVYKYSKATQSSQNQKPIRLSENSMTFPKGAADSVTINYAQVNELWVKQSKDDGESVILYSEESKHRVEFFAENFDNDEDFVQFKTYLEKVCTQITNRD